LRGRANSVKLEMTGRVGRAAESAKGWAMHALASRFSLMVSLLAALAPGLCAPAGAADFYAGKTVTIIVGSDVGGGYDTYARLFARHLSQHIPGHPALVVQNVPGAGSAKAAAQVFRAPKDGLTIGHIQPGAIVGPLFDDKVKANYDATKFIYLASADSSNRVCITMPNSKIKTFTDAQNTKVIVGTAGVGSSSRDYALLHKNTSGAKFELVSGYKGMADIMLAMERGEVDTVCGFDWSSIKAQRPGLVRDKKLHILAQAGLEPYPELTDLGVPDIMKFTKGDDNRAIVEIITSQQLFGRPFMLPPESPEAAVTILRTAFTAAMEDKDLLADAAKVGVDINPASGPKVQAVVEKMYGAPKRIIDLATKAIRE
jgi:tripartite-type tricarboxylate transporter receptor subunit TctC